MMPDEQRRRTITMISGACPEPTIQLTFTFPVLSTAKEGDQTAEDQEPHRAQLIAFARTGALAPTQSSLSATRVFRGCGHRSSDVSR